MNKKIIPNAITLSTLICGFGAFLAALDNIWIQALLLVLISAVLDVLDGYAARKLNARSELGAQLDSLCDMFNFVIIPVILLYLWALKHGEPSALLGAIVYLCCGTLRLAQFNTLNEEETKQGFKGIPTPAAAGLALTPMVLSFASGSGLWSAAPFVSAVLAVVGICMILPWPTPSFKNPSFSEKVLFSSALIACIAIVIFTKKLWACHLLCVSIYSMMVLKYWIINPVIKK